MGRRINTLGYFINKEETIVDFAKVITVKATYKGFNMWSVVLLGVNFKLHA